MPSVGSDCHELRIDDPEVGLSKAIVILYVLAGKKTMKTPKNVIDICKKRLAKYETRDGI